MEDKAGEQSGTGEARQLELAPIPAANRCVMVAVAKLDECPAAEG